MRRSAISPCPAGGARPALACVLLLLFMAVGVFLHWRRFEFRVGANEIRIDSGILSRTHRSIPFDRIQDVDITQGPLARLLGLARVKFETGGSSGEEEGVLQAIRLDRAEDLREPGPVAARPAGGRAGGGRRGVSRAAASLCDGPEAAHPGGDLQLLARFVCRPVRPDADGRRCGRVQSVQPILLAEPPERGRSDPRVHSRQSRCDRDCRHRGARRDRRRDRRRPHRAHRLRISPRSDGSGSPATTRPVHQDGRDFAGQSSPGSGHRERAGAGPFQLARTANAKPRQG